MMTTLLICSLIFHMVALTLVLIRLGKGPSSIDRALALDVTAAAIMGIVMVTSVWFLRSDLLPLIIVLACTGFISSTTIARFVSRDTEAKSGLLSPEEALALDQAQAAESASDDDDVDDGDLDAEETNLTFTDTLDKGIDAGERANDRGEEELG